MTALDTLAGIHAYLLAHLAEAPHPLDAPPAIDPSLWSGDDLQLALYVCYELHYRSFAGVDGRWEWHPEFLALRAGLEAAFEDGLSAMVDAGPAGEDVETALWRLAHGGGGPSLSGYVAELGTMAQMRELAVHRSAYQLKEADPHTWAIPRLVGGPKAALVEIQADEYGGGRAEDMHAALFALTMDELGLDPTYGAYLDWLPASTLTTVNLVSLFGLHRRLRGALVGHLAIFEMTSVTPMSRYAHALERLGVPARGPAFLRRPRRGRHPPPVRRRRCHGRWAGGRRASPRRRHRVRRPSGHGRRGPLHRPRPRELGGRAQLAPSPGRRSGRSRDPISRRGGRSGRLPAMSRPPIGAT